MSNEKATNVLSENQHLHKILNPYVHELIYAVRGKKLKLACGENYLRSRGEEENFE